MQEWEIFQEEVINLLELQGWNILKEHIAGHKKPDAIIEKYCDLGTMKRYAVECKYYQQKLQKEALLSIINDYAPLIEQNIVDSLLIITSNGLSASALTYCKNKKDILHLTYLELQNKLIDFSNYINGLIFEYSSDDLDKYYTPQNYEDENGESKNTLDQEVISWINSDNEKPIAILASYGMGKTSLSRHLSYVLSKSYLEDPRHRIPIYIRLESISSDQSLEGLLGKLFTAISVVSNYNFNIFQRLNKLGRFVIILDGFDEMKRTMSWDSMRYNFQQLNKLIVKNSKVILLGRPTAFLTEEEYWEAILGKKKVGNKMIDIQDWPNFREIRLSYFTPKQIEDFLTKYIRHIKCSNKNIHQLFEKSDDTNELKLVNEELIYDLSKRPVQLKMLVDILPSYDGPFDNFTTAVLYSEFIDYVIKREQNKLTRHAYLTKERRRFATDIAYHLWTKQLGGSITVDKIPESIFKSYIKEDIDIESTKRDLLSACFLERKGSEGFYFPHRSFLEYLFAERLYELFQTKNKLFYTVGYLTQEIVAFFVEMTLYGEVNRWHMDLIKKNDLDLSDAHLELFAKTCKCHGIKITKDDIKRLKRVEGSGSWIGIPSAGFLDKMTHPEKSPHKAKGVTKKRKYKK